MAVMAAVAVEDLVLAITVLLIELVANLEVELVQETHPSTEAVVTTRQLVSTMEVPVAAVCPLTRAVTVELRPVATMLPVESRTGGATNKLFRIN